METSSSTPGPAAQHFLSGPHLLYLGGEFVAAADGRTFGTVDPSTGAAITQVAHAGPADVSTAVAAARAALEGPGAHCRPQTAAPSSRAWPTSSRATPTSWPSSKPSTAASRSA